PAIRRPDGSPSNANPTISIAPSGPAPIGVPNFVIDRFTIPPFLLPIYQACGTQYGIPWQVLASINRIETAFGTNLNVSTAGAVGWMQFLPSTWKAYGVDANGDKRKDPYNPVDAICGAARYLKASGGEKDLGKAIFAYNHADWYVDEVLLYAKQYGKLPGTLVDSLTGLTEGAHFPVAARARYANDISEREAARRATPQKGSEGNVADVVSDSPTRRGIDIFSKEGAPVVAVNDGTIKKVGKNKRLGKFIVLQDAYGNQFTYANLGKVLDTVPVPKERKLSASDFKLVSPTRDGGLQVKKAINRRGSAGKADDAPKRERRGAQRKAAAKSTADSEDARERTYALPNRPNNRDRADLSGQLDRVMDKGVPGYETFKAYFTGVLEFDSKKMDQQALRKGTKVVAGTVLGEVDGDVDGVASHMNFAIEPTGRGSRKIDPKPILDGWKLLEATAIYRAAGKNPFDDQASVGQILLASKGQLQQMVLKDPRIEVYSCGRDDIKNGIVDRRVLASLAYLAERGFRPTVTSLACGRSSRFTSSGNLSAHPTGDAVDIARLNGLPVLGNQGKGSITEAAVRELMKLQGSMEPAQIITLMEMGGPTFAMADHADHIHLGFQPEARGEGKNFSLLKPDQWDRLVDRIGKLDQPKVPTKQSKFTIPAKSGKRASDAHVGE
ncbi:MAG: lytic murein transglycosylase, partial [Solirubrobacterales bacterium]